MIFSIIACICGLAACIDSARLDSATNVLGQFDELYVIAAAVIGGTSLSGGVGTIYASIAGFSTAPVSALQPPVPSASA